MCIRDSGDAERVVRHPLTDHQRSPETIAEHDEGSQAVPQALGEAVREVQPFPVADGQAAHHLAAG